MATYTQGGILTWGLLSVSLQFSNISLSFLSFHTFRLIDVYVNGSVLMEIRL